MKLKNKKGGDKKRHSQLVERKMTAKLLSAQEGCQSDGQERKLFVKAVALERPPGKGGVSC